MNLQELDIRAAVPPKIETIGGAPDGAVGGNVGVSGSVAVNMMNDVTAHIGCMATNGSVGVVAQSDEQISNMRERLAAVYCRCGIYQCQPDFGHYRGLYWRRR